MLGEEGKGKGLALLVQVLIKKRVSEHSLVATQMGIRFSKGAHARISDLGFERFQQVSVYPGLWQAER